MPYQREISRRHKACFLFLLNQSGTMREPIGDGTWCKGDEAARQVNTFLLNLTIQATGGGGINNWMDVGVLGYRADAEGKPIVESALQGVLAGRSLVSVVDLAAHPATVERVVQRVFDQESGETCEIPVETPRWVDPAAEHRAPARLALDSARKEIERWIAAHPDSFPPIVIHVTDGRSDDGDPAPGADALKRLATSDGDVLLFHCHVSPSAAEPILFPSRREKLPDAAARRSFDLSSRLPAPLFDRAVSQGFEIQPGARGMALNMDMAACTKLFDMGTRCAAPAPEGLRPQHREPADVARGDFATAEMPEDVDAAPPAAAAPEPALAAEPGGEPPHPMDENVQFSVYRPKVVQPERPYPLLAFAHLAERRPDAPEDEPDPIQEVQRQARLVLEARFGEYGDVRQDSDRALPHQGEITFVPEIPGVRFNPPSRSFFWEREESVHREEFRMRASRQLDGQTARGRLTVFLGSVIVAEVALAVRVDGSHRAKPSTSPTDLAFGRPYRKIFASYSHRDVAVVEEFEQYFKTVGDKYLRDWIELRAGEVWCERLEELIREADVFQLFWSTHSMRSRFVRQEWEYALALGRPYFVRPVYWEEPMPSDPTKDLPPEALLRLHFQRLPSAGGPHAPPARSAPAEIEAVCPECSTRYLVDAEHRGGRAECAECGAVFTIGRAPAQRTKRSPGEFPREPDLGRSAETRRRRPPDSEREEPPGTTDLQAAEPAVDASLPPSAAEEVPWRDPASRPTRRTSSAQIREPVSPAPLPDRDRPTFRTSTAESGERRARSGSPGGTIGAIGCLISLLAVGAYLIYRLVVGLLSLFS